MLEIILFALVGIVLVVGGYHAICHVICMWCGCTKNEAAMKIHGFFNGSTVKPCLTSDMAFTEEIQNNIRNIVGEKRFGELIRLSYTAISMPLLFFGESNGGLPYIAVSVYYNNENEKAALESTIGNIVRKYMTIYGYDTYVLTSWSMRADLNMPCLVFRYARTDDEKRILRIHSRNEQSQITAGRGRLYDDTENEDLHG